MDDEEASRSPSGRLFLPLAGPLVTAADLMQSPLFMLDMRPPHPTDPAPLPASDSDSDAGAGGAGIGARRTPRLFSQSGSETDPLAAPVDADDSDDGGVGVGAEDPVIGSISAWVSGLGGGGGRTASPAPSPSVTPVLMDCGAGSGASLEVRRCLGYFRRLREQAGTDRARPALSPLPASALPFSGSSALAPAAVHVVKAEAVASPFPSSRSPTAGKRPRAAPAPARVAHAAGLRLRVPLALLPPDAELGVGGAAAAAKRARYHRRRDLAVQTEEAPPPASRPTAAVPPVPAAVAAAGDAAQLQQLTVATERAQAGRAAALERQWRDAPLESLLSRARAHKQRTDAALKAGESEAARLHFLRASVLFLAGCWAAEERRRAAANGSADHAASGTRQTYQEIASFVRYFARLLLRAAPASTSRAADGSDESAASGCLAELSLLMLLSVVEYRQYYCHRQELASQSAAMKSGDLAAEQREQCLGQLLHLYHATETWAHMARARDKMRLDAPGLVRLEEEVVRRSGFRPSGPADRLSHLLAHLQAAADVLAASAGEGGGGGGGSGGLAASAAALSG